MLSETLSKKLWLCWTSSNLLVRCARSVGSTMNSTLYGLRQCNVVSIQKGTVRLDADIEPGGYIHRDAYEFIPPCAHLRRGLTMAGSINELLIARSSSAVSYTHLDVYKRQFFCCLVEQLLGKRVG